MKINNPMKFYPELNNIDAVAEAEMRMKSILMSRGDVIRKYAPSDSMIESDWHTGEPNNDDTFMKFSFDGGITYPLKYSFKNELVIKIDKPGKFLKDDVITYDLSTYSTSVYEAAKNGILILNSYDIDGWNTNIITFKYQYNIDEKKLNIKLLSDLPTDSEGIVLTIGVDGSNSNALAVSSPLYSSLINAVPTTYDANLGICNLLDEKIPAITCLTKLEDINSLSLKVISADDEISGNVALRFNCGNSEWTQNITVTKNETWVDIIVPNNLTGTLVITRLCDSKDDTLKDKENDIIISLCVTNIRVERV